MAVNNVDIYVSRILEDLSNGLTWYKRDDQGYGSIQEKYGAKDLDIVKLRLNPKLKDAETTLTIFNLIDDTDEPNTNLSGSTEQIDTRATSTSAEVQPLPHTSANGSSAESFPVTEQPSPVYTSSSNDDDGLAAFTNL